MKNIYLMTEDVENISIFNYMSSNKSKKESLIK